MRITVKLYKSFYNSFTFTLADLRFYSYFFLCITGIYIFLLYSYYTVIIQFLYSY